MSHSANNPSSLPPPPDFVLTSLGEIIDAWTRDNRDPHRYRAVADKCLTLLKRKKVMKDLGLVGPLQRTLLQAWLQEEQYDRVVEWATTTAATPAEQDDKSDNDLILYARYRRHEYDTVTKQALAAVASLDQTTPSSSSSSLLLLRHLVAQAHFHLNQAEPSLRTYGGLLSDETTNDDVDADGGNIETLTNVLAVIATSVAVPTVSLRDDETCTSWMEKAAEVHRHAQKEEQKDEDNSSLLADLAYNLGSLLFLTDPTLMTAAEDWLDVASTEAAANPNGGGDDDSFQIHTNRQWSRHFWYRDIDDVSYPTSKTSKSANKNNGSNNSSTSTSTSGPHDLPVPQSIAKLNQSLLMDDPTKVPSLPHPKWNSLQVAMYWYSRAVLQLKAQQLVECQESCQSLKKAVGKLGSGNAGSGGGGGAGKKKKNKGGTTPAPSSSSSSSSSSPMELWWESRVDVLLAYVQHSQSKTKDAISKLDASLETLKHAASSSSSSSSLVLAHATAHVQLHRYMLDPSSASANTAKWNQQLQSLLTSLPQPVQTLPAVQLTLEELRSTAGPGIDSGTTGVNGKAKKEKVALSPLDEADSLFAQGQYDAACELYETELPTAPGKNVNNNDDKERILDAQLRYVQALAATGQHTASQRLFQSLEGILDDPVTLSGLPDAVALETKGLPRSTGHSSSGNGTTKTSLSKKLLDATGAHGPDDDGKADQPSREKALRQRARKREAYLKELEARGQYNPDRPAKPNPERWIPKHERSRSRGGGKGSRFHPANNRSAQGGGSQADALRLDAAARRAGVVPANSGPSTANLKVSSGTRKGGRRR